MRLKFPQSLKRIWLHTNLTPARDYHAYIDIWNPLIGETLKCRREPADEVGKHAFEIMRSNSQGKESVVGHIPQNISKFSNMSLMILFTSIEVEVVGKRLNRRGGYGLEIPVKYRFYCQQTIVQSLTKKFETVKKCQNEKMYEINNI